MRLTPQDDAATLAWFKHINPDHNRIWSTWDDFGRKGNRNGAGAVRLLHAPNGVGAMSNHTPAPWFVEEYGDEDSPALVIHKDSENRICFMATPGSHGDPERIAADANLIAAAADMLVVLETIENDAGQIPDWLWERIQAVITKAGGRAKCTSTQTT